MGTHATDLFRLQPPRLLQVHRLLAQGSKLVVIRLNIEIVYQLKVYK